MERQWLDFTWNHHEDTTIVNGLEDVRVMVSQTEQIDAKILRDPSSDHSNDPKQDHDYLYLSNS